MNSELLSLRADVESLSLDLLNRYEEIALPCDLGHDTGAVPDVEQVSRTALPRSLRVIPAGLGQGVRQVPTRQQLRHVNAGHQPALLRGADCTLQESDADGMPLGIFVGLHVLPTSDATRSR